MAYERFWEWCLLTQQQVLLSTYCVPSSLSETRCHSGEQNKQVSAQGELTVW